MEEEWEPILLEIIAYKETSTNIMRSGDESAQQLDDHIVMTLAMSFSPYKKPFEARIMTWENKLRITQDVMEEWLVLYCIVYVCVCVCVCMCVYVCVCVVYACACMYVRMHVCVYIYAYSIYILTGTL